MEGIDAASRIADPAVRRMRLLEEMAAACQSVLSAPEDSIGDLRYEHVIACIRLCGET